MTNDKRVVITNEGIEELQDWQNKISNKAKSAVYKRLVTVCPWQVSPFY